MDKQIRLSSDRSGRPTLPSVDRSVNRTPIETGLCQSVDQTVDRTPTVTYLVPVDRPLDRPNCCRAPSCAYRSTDLLFWLHIDCISLFELRSLNYLFQWVKLFHQAFISSLPTPVICRTLSVNPCQIWHMYPSVSHTYNRCTNPYSSQKYV